MSREVIHGERWSMIASEQELRELLSPSVKAPSKASKQATERARRGKLCTMSEQPQEWTQDENCLISPAGQSFALNDRGTAGRLKQAINAALAAVRAACVSELDQAYAKGAQHQHGEDERELAALRDELFRMTKLDGKRQHDILKLEQQLAAEREKADNWTWDH
jgi:hypothetical protein